MAIHDLLWGCPLCRRANSLRRSGRREVCRTCGASFARGAAATIVARRNGEVLTRSAAEWLRELGEPPPPEPDAHGVVLGPTPTQVRVASTDRPLRAGGELLGWIEVFGRPVEGVLTLSTERFTFAPRTPFEGRRDSANAGFDWPLAEISAVQAASSALHIAAGRSVASIRFARASLRLWTRAVTSQLRRYYDKCDRDVVEFQPRLRTRPRERGTIT